MAEAQTRSSLHIEKFKKTGKARSVWDLAQMSTKSVAISTELPEDIINLIEENGPIMEARGLIATNTSYSIVQYAIISKIIALNMAINGLTEPNPNLTRFLIKRKKIRQPLPKKKMMEYYPGKNTIPMSSAIPIEIAKLAEEYGPILVKHNMIPSSTPYNMWKFCVTSVMLELSRLIKEGN